MYSYTRELPEAGKYDVFVAGSGPAGIAAAVSAARCGASVLMAERYGCVGGNLVSGHVAPIMGGLADGYLAEELRRVIKRDDDPDHSPDPEYARVRLPAFLRREGIEVWTGTAVCDAVTENGSLTGVILASPEGMCLVRCACAVDATGDGTLAALAGCKWEMGRRSDGLCQPASVMFTISGVDPSQTLLCHHEEDETILSTGKGYLELCHDANASGELPKSVNIVRLYPTEHPGERMVNATQANRHNGLSRAGDWDAQCELRGQIALITDFLKKNVPGFQHIRVVGSTEGSGFRETRRILGVYVLDDRDLMAGRRFPDVVVHRAAFAIDIHNPDGAGQSESEGCPRQPQPYDIPYRCLIPMGVDRLLTAGRCISGTHEAHASYRVMNICMATGEAAGIAAALCVKRGVTPRVLGHIPVQEVLTARGVELYA